MITTDQPYEIGDGQTVNELTIRYTGPVTPHAVVVKHNARVRNLIVYPGKAKDGLKIVGENVRIRGRQSRVYGTEFTHNCVYLHTSCNNSVIQGITTDGGTNGISIQGDHNELRKCTFGNYREKGVRVVNSIGTLLSRVHSRANSTDLAVCGFYVNNAEATLWRPQTSGHMAVVLKAAKDAGVTLNGLQCLNTYPHSQADVCISMENPEYFHAKNSTFTRMVWGYARNIYLHRCTFKHDRHAIADHARCEEFRALECDFSGAPVAINNKQGQTISHPRIFDGCKLPTPALTGYHNGSVQPEIRNEVATA